jgi:hypothetical protein
MRFEDSWRLADEAWRLADELGLAKTYDAEFVALAAACWSPPMRGCVAAPIGLVSWSTRLDWSNSPTNDE